MTCSMPLDGEHEKFVGLETSEGLVCVHDLSDGKLKTPAEIFEGGVQWYLGAVSSADRGLAERLTRKNMNTLPYWKTHHDICLEGDQSSEEEYNSAMARL